MDEQPKLSYLAEHLEGSQILRYSAAVNALRVKGREVFNFTVGDFDPQVFPIPIQLKKEIMKAYAEDYTNYPLAEGNLDLRTAITSFEKEWNGLVYHPSEVLVGSGGRPLIFAFFQAICDKGDKVIYGTPSWNNNYYAKLTRAKNVEIETRPEESFLLTARDIRPHLRDAVLICLCSPQNPTGTGYSRDELAAICDLVVAENSRRTAEEKKLYLLYDAMYGVLSGNENGKVSPVHVCPEIRPYVLTVNAVSKVFAATGLRVGWCLGPSSLLSKMKNLLSHMGAWAPMAEQKAVARFLLNSKGINEFLGVFRSELSLRLDTIYAIVTDLKRRGYPVDAIAPSGGLYLSVKIDIVGKKAGSTAFHSAADVADYLLQKSAFAILPFSAFGSPPALPWFRISVGTARRHDLAALAKGLEKSLTPFCKLSNVNV